MLDTEYDCVIRFVETVLAEKTGISERAYMRLRQLTDTMHECPDHAERSHRIDGLLDDIRINTEGRYFLGITPRRRY